MSKIEELEQIASQVRRDIIRQVHGVQSGHPGGSLGCADLLTALYFEVLKHDPKNFTMGGEDQDIFFLSNGHISPVLYSVLARSGYFDISELATFRKLHTKLQGHPSVSENTPGIRIASGSLGQGLSVGIGAATTKRLNNDPNYVYVLMGDGELEEGQVWEAALYASAKKVDNIIGIVDYNKKQIDGATDDVVSLGNLKAKWEAFDWAVLEMDGHNMSEILSTLRLAKALSGKGKPVIILMHSEMGKGVDFMEGTHKWHGNPPSDEQKDIALAQLKETLGDY